MTLIENDNIRFITRQTNRQREEMINLVRNPVQKDTTDIYTYCYCQYFILYSVVRSTIRVADKQQKNMQQFTNTHNPPTKHLLIMKIHFSVSISSDVNKKNAQIIKSERFMCVEL